MLSTKKRIFSLCVRYMLLSCSVIPVVLSAADTTNIEQVQRTFTMIKPRAVQEGHTGEILTCLEKAGFRIVALRMRTLSKEEISGFYAEHSAKPFFQDILRSMSSGPVVTCVVEKQNAVADLRCVVGATDPKKAAYGTVRSLFGKSVTDNAIHASDSPQSAQREVSFFFSQDEIAS